MATQDKLEVLNQAIAIGFAEVEVTSFVPPANVPQFSDAEAVLEGVRPRAGVKLRVIAPNPRGVQRACKAKAAGAPIDVVGFPLSVSEAHNVANLGREHKRHLQELTGMIPDILAAGMEPLAGLATSFGCPLSGPVSRREVLRLASWLHAHGVKRIMLGDTTGLADPVSVMKTFKDVHTELPEVELVAHFHDTRGSGMVNTFAALTAGVQSVDASMGGLGGEPASVKQNHAGETGNISTEDFVVLLKRTGIESGVDVSELFRTGLIAEARLGQESRSQVLRTGLGL